MDTAVQNLTDVGSSVTLAATELLSVQVSSGAHGERLLVAQRHPQ